MEKRTNQQNKALHKLFTLVAEELDKKNVTTRELIESLDRYHESDLTLNSTLVKELIWKSFQRVHLGKESTTELSSKEIDQIYDEVNLYLGENFHVHVDFPSNENDNPVQK